MDGSLLGNSLVSGLVAQCDAWPKGMRPADFHQPLASDWPALLLSVELDPVTPPAYAERVVKTLPNGRSLVLRGQGHNVIGAGCMPKLFAQFLKTADAKGLDVECLDKLAYTPPFMSFNGCGPCGCGGWDLGAGDWGSQRPRLQASSSTLSSPHPDRKSVV